MAKIKKDRAFVQNRIIKLVLVLLFLMGVVVFRYAWLQLVQGSELSERMRYQVGHDYSVQSPRGAIVDRNGRELAVSTMTKSLFVDPNHVENPQQLAQDLSPLINKSVEDILEDIKVGGGFVWVKRRLEQSEYEAIRILIREKGYAVCLGFRDEAKRYYPNDVLAANVLGFVGTDDKGLDGIEQALDKYIKGEVTESFIYADTQERPILESIFTPRGYQGDRCKTIQLTIDSAIQFIVEQELDRAMAENSPLAITCIAMDPRTGEILAMANRPTYNPNRFWDYDQEIWKNKSVSSIYEPGSTFKAVVAGALLQEGIVAPNQVFVDPGYVIFSGKKIQNWNGASFGTVTFADVVKQSLNTGFAIFGYDLGAKKLIEYARLFGFGEITGIEQELGTKRREAQSQADEILSTTRAEARRMIADAEQEIEACKNELRFLSLRKQQFLKDTSSFLDEFSKIIDKAQSDCERDFYNDDNANQNSIQNQSLNFNPDTVHLDKDYDGEFVYDENLQPQYQEQAPEQEQELDYGYNHNGEYSDMDNDSISEQK